MHARFLIPWLVAAWTMAATALVAQPGTPARPRPSPGVPADRMPAIFREVGFDQRLDERIPLDIPFRDHTGRIVTLDGLFGERPIVLALVYYACPMLCTQVLNGLVGSLEALSFDAGREFDVVIVSFDPREGPEQAAAKRTTALTRYGRFGTEAGWHFLTGDEAGIRRLTEAVGFRYVFDESLGQFAHPSGVTVLTPQGRLARYFFGIEYAARDLRLAIVEASQNRIGSPIDQVLLYCYHYDPGTGRYGLMVMRLVRLGGVLTIVALAAFIVIMRRAERR